MTSDHCDHVCSPCVGKDCLAAPPTVRAVLVDELLRVVPDECWVFRIEATERLNCTRLIGGKIGEGDVEFTEEMCCLPCRIRLVVERNGVDV